MNAARAAPDAVAGAAAKVAEVASKGLAAAKGPLHAIRGTGENEKMLKNAKTEYWNEFEEIATYTAIETLAEAVGDKDTAKLAKSIRREEERMAKFLEQQIPSLAKGVATEEIPAAERRRTPRASSRRRGPAGRNGASASAHREGLHGQALDGKATTAKRTAPPAPRRRAATARPARPASRPARAPASARPASRIAPCVPAHGSRLARDRERGRAAAAGTRRRRSGSTATCEELLGELRVILPGRAGAVRLPAGGAVQPALRRRQHLPEVPLPGHAPVRRRRVRPA